MSQGREYREWADAAQAACEARTPPQERLGCAWCGKCRQLNLRDFCRWCEDRFKWEEWHRGLSAPRTRVNVLPVERNPAVIDLSTAAPPQPIPEGRVAPRDF